MPHRDKLRDYKIPSLPRAALRVLELVQDPEVDLEVLRDAIELDPALCSRMVRLANSSLFGFSRRVCSVHQALVVLGLRTVKLTALSFSLIQALPRDQNNLRLLECWRRVLTNATGCRLAAGLLGCEPEQAFLTGLLQDIAMVVLGNSHGEKYFDLIAASACEDGPPIHELERQELGIDHAELGAAMLEEWRLPAPIVDAVAMHHRVDLDASLAEKNYERTTLMAMVERITEFLLYPTHQNFEAFDRVAASFGESRSEIDKFLQRLELEVQKMAELLDLSSPDGTSCEEMMNKVCRVAVNLGFVEGDSQLLIDAHGPSR